MTKYRNYLDDANTLKDYPKDVQTGIGSAFDVIYQKKELDSTNRYVRPIKSKDDFAKQDEMGR